MPTTKNTGYPCEWYMCKGGVRHYWTKAEVATANRRATDRQTRVTAHRVEQATQQPQRQCAICGKHYTIRAFEGATPKCPRCRTMAATQAKHAKREAAA